MADTTTVVVSPDVATTVIIRDGSAGSLSINDPGVAGPPTVLVVGTVTAGLAAVTITGVAPTQTLNFVLPIAGSFRHIQSAPATTWNITHNLGYYPGGVSVVDSGGNTCLGDIQYTDTNSLVVNFADAFSGVAYLS